MQFFDKFIATVFPFLSDKSVSWIQSSDGIIPYLDKSNAIVQPYPQL